MRFELQLKEIALHNFRLFDIVKVAFDDKLTILISENGAGKTALLEGIAKALTVVTERLAHDENNLNNKGIYRVEDIKNETAASTTTLQLLSKLELDGLPNLDTTIGWELRLNRKTAMVKVEQEGTYLEDVTHQVDAALNTKQPVALPVVVYYSCERISTDSKNGKDETYGMTMFDAYHHALDGQSLDYKRFLAWYDWQERIERKTKNNRVLDIVRQSILDILNDADDTAFSTIDIDPSEYNNPKLIIQKGDDKVEVNQLSSGEKSLLMLVSNLAYRMALLNPNAKDPLKEGQGIVLIDEIDLHLHPRWQRAVIPKLRSIFPKIQWIITTHSPQVLGAVEGAKIFILDNKQVRLLDFNTYGKDMNRILDRIMGVPERNEKVLEDFDHYFELIELNELEEAQNLRQSLEKRIGTDEPLFRRADGILKRKQLIGR
jgi:predicted ATP-binding protein involved in virulence